MLSTTEEIIDNDILDQTIQRSVSFSLQTLKKATRLAKKNGMSRSAFIRKLIEEYEEIEEKQ